MKSFTVLTVTKRNGWQEDAMKCISKQTTKPKSWIVIGEYGVEPIGEFHRAPQKTKLSNLNSSINEGLRHIDTDYVIFYQDFIDLPPDCFEKLLALVDEKTFVTTCTPNYDGSDDRRYTGIDGPRKCRPEEWETNVAIAPMVILRDKLGGFNEELDWGWSWDNVEVAQRAAMIGCKFIIDESNRPKLYPHEMSSHQTLPLNAQRCANIIRDIRNGIEPIKHKYI